MDDDLTPLTIHLRPDQVALLDAWIAALPEPHPSRAEAVRAVLDAAIRLGGLDPEIAD